MYLIPGAKLITNRMFRLEHKDLSRKVFGVDFENPVGLAAGFDKDAKFFDEMSCLGFGFLEIGTITPKPQPGNEKPRLFRLPKDHALINRMGFNNFGLQSAIERLKKRKKGIVIGGNIGKNKITPNENAVDDYLLCFNELFDYVDYFVVNVSSPNTPNLRALQDKEPLKNILTQLQECNQNKKKPKPILLKIAPDLSNQQLDDVVEIVLDTKLAGVVATNTTIARNQLNTPTSDLNKIGNGGLSGKPLAKRSTEVIRYIHKASKGTFPIIGVGGIHSAEDALDKLRAGASLIQLYTGFIYEGPSLIRQINNQIIKKGL